MKEDISGGEQEYAMVKQLLTKVFNCDLHVLYYYSNIAQSHKSWDLNKKIPTVASQTKCT